jgi:predicted DNA-binding protein
MQRFRKFTNGITFFVSQQMRQELDTLSEERRQTVSELLREMIEHYLKDTAKTASNAGRKNESTE